MKLEFVPRIRTNTPPMCTNHANGGTVDAPITPYEYQSNRKCAPLHPVCVLLYRLPGNREIQSRLEGLEYRGLNAGGPRISIRKTRDLNVQ